MIPHNHIIKRLIHSAEQPWVMGILNITPDSFSDGNQFLSIESAKNRAEVMIQHGVDIIDIGGESTRPGAKPISDEEEIARVIPVIQAIREFSTVPLSIDTRKSKVADAAIQAGIDIVNDVSAFRFDPLMADVLADYPEIGIILMHAQGTPETMQLNPQFQDVVNEIIAFFADRIAHCHEAGISTNRILLDPGIGFGKDLEHNLTILGKLHQFHTLGLPIVLGASRKRFIDTLSPSSTQERLGGSLAATAFALEAHANLVRVHDVLEHKQFIKVYTAIQQRV